MKELDKISKQMRSDWDRRIGHDYRFWMSDGYRDDANMWETGERDFSIVSRDIPNLNGKVVLEIGCGVGRMLKAAASACKKVIGVDVAPKAIERAREFLGSPDNLELIVGNGLDLRPVPDASVDFVWSFASITSMPLQVLAGYLTEIRRVLKPDGICRLQVYLGEEMMVCGADTLHLRCFRIKNFEKGVGAAGLDVGAIDELILPFKVSFADIGVTAYIATLTPSNRHPEELGSIAEQLLPGGEPDEGGDLSATDIEYWMLVNYAEEMAKLGDMDKAREALEFAATHCKSTAIDVKDLLDRIVGAAERRNASPEPNRKPIEASKGATEMVSFSSELFETNMRVLEKRFPAIHRQLETLHRRYNGTVSGTEVRNTDQGPSIFVGAMSVDHPQQPEKGAESWVSRSLQEKRVETAKHLIVYGFGAGYHVERLMFITDKQISCIEPRSEILYLACGSRNLAALFDKLAWLSVDIEAEIPGLDKDSEIVMRPQSQSLDPECVERVKSRIYGKRGFISLRPQIAVLGPLQGGTLPITHYVQNALGQLDQRSRSLDMSGFNPGWHLVDNFVKHEIRQQVLKNSYVEMVSQVVLESFSEKPIDILICMAQAPISPRVMMELRKRGVITVLWFVEDYMRFTYWREMAQYYDFVFTIQKGECLRAIKAAGAGEVHYLPTACDTLSHYPLTLNAEEKARWGSPISFVGAGYHNRQQVFASLAHYPMKLWGTEWPTCRPFDKILQEGGRRLLPEEYIKIFNSTDVNINLHSSAERDTVDPNGDFLNPRTFELAACGAFQLVDSRTLLRESFEPGKEVATFTSVSELRDGIDYYLAHPEERAQIAQRGRERVLKEHTYVHRIESMLSTIFASKYDQLRLRRENSPWTKVLRRSEAHPELAERCQKAFERGEEPTLDALVSDIVTGNGKLSETEQKLLFLFHVRKQIIRMHREETGAKP